MRSVLYLLIPVLFVGCGETTPDWPVSFDLVEGLAVADSWSETRLIDLGTHRGRRHLVSGWSGNRWDRQRERGFVLGQGSSSMLEFEVIEPRSMALRLLAGPVDQLAESPSVVEVLVNGTRIGDLSLRGRPRRNRLPVPEGLLRRGLNELALHPMRRTDEPDRRVRWYQIEFQYQDKEEPPLPFVTGEDDSLMIPYGTRLEYTLKLPAESAVTIDRLQFVGDAGGRLSVWVEEDGVEATQVHLPEGVLQGIRQTLPTGEPRIARVTLRADHPRASVSLRSGVMLTSAAIRVPSVSTKSVPSDPVPAVPTISNLAAMPNILLYVVDTLRADHLGVYGYDKPVSPALDRFATQATVFDNAVAQSSWTRASMASIFTGLWPLKHAANGRKDVLDPAATTLAEVLGQAGYVTAAKVRNWNVFPVFGFRQGFDEFHKVREGKADRLTALVEAWLDTRPRDRPFFLWVHTVDPHEPYRPPAETLSSFMGKDQVQFDLDKHPGFKLTREMSEEERRNVVEFLLSLYDAEIAFNDRAFGDLVALLETLELLDSTVVIFVSDHGEEFLDHGTWGHGRNLYAENLNVPLVVRFPGVGQGLRIEEVVQQIDLMPTLLDYVGLPVPDGIEGRSFLPLLEPGEAQSPPQPRPAFSYLHLDGAVYRSLVDEDWKLVQRLADDGGVSQTGLFHRPSDPGETHNQIDKLPIRGRFMELVLEAKMAEGGLLTTEEAELDEETEKALKALGYLQ